MKAENYTENSASRRLLATIGGADRPLFTSTFQRQSKFYSLPVRARDKNLQRNNKTLLNENLTLPWPSS
jgi:hypothetical protein